MSDHNEEKLVKKTFKQRYDDDPEFKAKHLDYVKQKIMCECGKNISRSNMSAHVKTKLHTKKLKPTEQTEAIKRITDLYLDALGELSRTSRID